jgi:hypothetical protein
MEVPTVRCLACGANNKDDAPRCKMCGGKLVARPRGEAGGEPVLGDNPTARAAYHCSLFALIPLLGLVLGPVAVVLGVIAWRKEQRDPTPWGFLRAGAAIFLGGLIALTSWIGIALMAFGLSVAAGVQ